MSNAIPVMRLTMIQHVFLQKEKDINQQVGNLQLNDVKEDAAFQRTTTRIKNDTLLKPVTFSNPEIKSHRQVEKRFSSSYEFPMPHTKNVCIVNVDFTFEGSSELFKYAPNGLSYGSSDTRMYQPGYGNVISLEVEIPQLDRDAAIAKANSMMATTFSIINQINPQAEQWSTAKEPIIDADLDKKRAEILNFYK